MHFEPQAVDSKSWRTWFVEGLQLSARKPVAFAVLALLFAGFHYLPTPLDSIMLLMVPLFLGLGCRLAFCADHGRPSWEVIASPHLLSGLRLILVGALPLAVLVVFGVLLRLFIGAPDGEAFRPEAPPPVAFEGGMAALVVTGLWLFGAGFFLWFLLPLLSVPALPLKEAFNQTVQAQIKNPFVRWLAICLALLAFTLLIIGAPILAVPLIPVLSCMMYVSYRHIWLDRLQNEPKLFIRDAAAPASPVPLNYQRARP